MRNVRTIVILVILVSFFAVACGGAEQQPAAPTATPAESTDAGDQMKDTDSETDGDLATVRVGHVPVTIYAPFYIALEKGYFEDEGIDAELMPVQGGTENVVQVSAGNFEVAGGGVGAGMLNAAARGVEFEIAAPMHTERPPLTSPFVVSKERFDNGELTSMSDLEGLTVSTNAKGAATEYWLWRALQQGNLGFDDVEVIGVGFREVPAALENRSLDGAILGEPLTTFAENEGVVARLSEDFIDRFTATYVYFNKEWATENPDLAKGFVKAFIRGSRDLNGDQWYDEENLQIIQKYTEIPVEVIEHANRSYHDPNGAVPMDDIMELQRFFMDQGQTNYDEPLDMEQFVNSSYAEAAVEELGGPVEWK